MVNFLQTKIKISQRELRSRELRKFSTGGALLNPLATGIRKIDVDQIETGPGQQQTIGGQIQQIADRFLNPVKKFFGFAWAGIVRMFRVSFSQIWGTIVNLYFQLKTFNWNQMDSQIEQTIKQNNQALLTQAGAALGTALGWGTVRLASFAIGRILGKRDSANKIHVPVLSARVSAALAEEGNEETKAALNSFLMNARNTLQNNMFLGFILTARRNEWFGMNSIEKPLPSDTFAQRIEKKIEQLPQQWQGFAENLIEEFEEAIIEAGYVVSFELDDHYRAMRLAQQDARGPERVIVIQPDKRIENEKIVVAGPQDEVIQHAQAVVHQTQLIQNRDIGQYVGYPVDEYIRRKLLTRQLQIIWRSVKQPLWLHENGSRAKESIINIPRAKIGLTWREVKDAANNFIWGEWSYSLKLYEANNFVGLLMVLASTKQECERRAARLLKLTTAEPREGNFSQQGDRNPNRKRKPTPMYPAFATLTVRKDSDEDLERIGREYAENPGKKYFDFKQRIELWTETEPKGFQGFR